MGRVEAVVAPGLMVMAIILFMGAVSGAHLNPAVSIAFAARGDFPWKRVPGYIAAQLLGATIACAFLWAVFGNVGMLGATRPGPGISDLQALVMELVLTLGLVSVILGTASKAQNVGPIAALAVGGYIALAGLWASPISGASMNPAQSSDRPPDRELRPLRGLPRRPLANMAVVVDILGNLPGLQIGGDIVVAFDHLRHVEVELLVVTRLRRNER